MRRLLLGYESDLNWIIVSGVHADGALYFSYFVSVDLLPEVDFPDPEPVELLLNKFLVEGKVLLVIFERLFYLLHFDPLVERINHLLFLLVYVLKDVLFLSHSLK